MAEVFEGQLIDWNKFTAKDAANIQKKVKNRFKKRNILILLKK